MLAALCAVLGHTFTPWLGFRGGKGVATGAGVVIALFQWWVVPVLGLFGLVLLTTRFVSLGSIMAAMLLAALALSVPAIRPYWPFALAALVLVLWTHRSNIDRLFAGTESRVGAAELRRWTILPVTVRETA
jgi:glycerol-3-phosphate acyltransferase PlsY